MFCDSCIDTSGGSSGVWRSVSESCGTPVEVDWSTWTLSAQVITQGSIQTFLSLSLSLPLSLSFFLSLSLSPSLPLSLSFFLSLSLSPSLFLSFSLSLSLPPPLSFFLSPSLSIFLSRSFSLYLSLSFSLSPLLHSLTDHFAPIRCCCHLSHLFCWVVDTVNHILKGSNISHWFVRLIGIFN